MAAQYEEAVEALKSPSLREMYEREQKDFMKELAATVNTETKKPAYASLMDRYQKIK